MNGLSYLGSAPTGDTSSTSRRDVVPRPGPTWDERERMVQVKAKVESIGRCGRHPPDSDDFAPPIHKNREAAGYAQA
jgi:hypothetical protein